MHAVLQRPGMPVKTISICAVQVMVDLIRDVLEKVMDEAATCESIPDMQPPAKAGSRCY